MKWYWKFFVCSKSRMSAWQPVQLLRCDMARGHGQVHFDRLHGLSWEE